MEDYNSKPAFGFQNSRNANPHEIPFPSHSWSLEMLLRRLKAIDVKRDDKFASVLEAVGEFGTFQWRLVALTFIPSMLSSYFMLSDHFMLTDQKPYCNTSWILAVGPNLSTDEQLNLTLPRAPNGSFLTCLMYIPVPWDLDSIINSGLNYTETCKYGWIYPYAKTRSLINEFDLVCGNEPNKESMQTMFLVGILTGSLLFGLLSDKMGRYPAILVSLLGLLIFGFGAAFVKSFDQYLFFRLVMTQAAVGYAISSVSLVLAAESVANLFRATQQGGAGIYAGLCDANTSMTEWLVGHHRAQAIILELCFMSVGVLFLSGSAYKIFHWRLLFLLGGVPMLPLISNIWVLRESPRWLMVKGKVEEAKKVLSYAAEVNKKTIPLNLLNELQLQGKKVTKSSVLDFCTNQRIFKVVLPMACVWYSVSYIYLTLSLKMKDFGVDNYVRYVIPGILEVPARLCCIVLLEYFGRKCSLFLSLTLATIICLFLLFLPQELKSIIILMLVLGEFCLAATVSVFFIYTAELLPTVLRSTGLGMVSLAWAAGANTALAVSSKIKTQLPILFCCLSCVVALCFASLVPETGTDPLRDSIEYSSSIQRDSIESKRRSQDIASMIIAEESLSDIGSDEVEKDTILNATLLKSEDGGLLDTALEKPSNREVSSPDP